jgi:alpha 1,3-mannosyltransferase
MIFDDGWRLAGWAAKPFAILVSSFREVIFIDADSLFFKNPEVLFDDADYKETGALFFRDRLIMPESKKRFLQQILPKPIAKLAKQSRFWTGESGHMQESGVVVVSINLLRAIGCDELTCVRTDRQVEALHRPPACMPLQRLRP